MPVLAGTLSSESGHASRPWKPRVSLKDCKGILAPSPFHRLILRDRGEYVSGPRVEIWGAVAVN